jgi:hypothetical protein
MRVPSQEDLQAIRLVREEAVVMVRRMLSTIESRGKVDSREAGSVVDLITDHLLSRSTAAITQVLLSQMRRIDEDLFDHAIDVCTLSLMVAREQKFSANQLMFLGMGTPSARCRTPASTEKPLPQAWDMR